MKKLLSLQEWLKKFDEVQKRTAKSKLVLPLLFLLAVSAQAQSTNVTALRLTFNEGNTTNNTTITINPRESEGFLINFRKDALVAIQLTNPPPTFQNSIRGTAQTFLLNPLADQARADERRTNKVDVFIANIGSYWEGLSSAQKQSIKDIANAVVVP